MDPLTLFGLVAVTAMVIFYSLERRSPWFILAFAGSCSLASVYGFLQGAWPFGLVEAVWTGVAVWRWWQVNAAENKPPSRLSSAAGGEEDSEMTAQKIILNVIRERGKAQRHDLLPQVGLSRSNLGRLLDQMEAQGLIRQVGERKCSYYVLAERPDKNL